METKTKSKLFFFIGVISFLLFLVITSFTVFLVSNLKNDPEFRARIKSIVVPNSLSLQLGTDLMAKDFIIVLDKYNRGKDLVVFDGDEYKAIPSDKGVMNFTIYYQDQALAKFNLNSTSAWSRRDYKIRVYKVEDNFFYDIAIYGQDGYVKEGIESLLKDDVLN